MKTVIRHWVFETNSSSTHSFSIDTSGDYISMFPDEHWDLLVGFWEYGWNNERFTEIEDKMSYVATFLFSGSADVNENFYNDDIKTNGKYRYTGNNKNILAFEKMLKEHTGASNICYNIYEGSCYPFGYIDHQSRDVGEDAFKNMKDAIFGRSSILNTGNDNG